MQFSFSGRWKRAAIIGLSLLVLGGCSALRLGYNQAPQLAHWWLDGYLDLTDEQSPRVKAALAQWFAWHRETQLDDYAGLLASAQADLAAPITAAQACQWADRVRAHVTPAVERALPSMTELALTITPAQLQHLEKRYMKNNEKLRKDFLQPDPAERQAAAVDRTVDRFESIYGRLDGAQRELVAAAVVASPFDPATWVAEREQRQRDVLDTLRRIQAQPVDAAQTTEMLRGLIRRFDGSAPARSDTASQRLTQYNCEFAARVHNATTASQRRHARDKLRGWEVDLRQLAAESRHTPARAALLQR